MQHAMTGPLLTQTRRSIAGAVALLALLAAGCGSQSSEPATPATPNILFFVIDDVGVDQMKLYGYGGADAPRTPVIDAVAEQGVKFTNTWAMPECSPSRAMYFNGRYPIRTNITSAILSTDLANSQMSPYESTTPKLLKAVGYQNGLFGKSHFSGSPLGPNNNPYGNTEVSQLGWDQFVGWFDGGPRGIDTTAGGIAPTGTHQCGYVPTSAADATNGADAGACYTVDGTCSELSLSAATPVPGRACMERGGILVPKASCAATRPAMVDFTKENAYYAGTLVQNDPDGTATVLTPQDPAGRGRGYRTTIEADAAVVWIKSRPAGKPWMATLSLSSAHSPYQPPPVSSLPRSTKPFDGLACDQDNAGRELMNQMIESADQAIGRVLVETGVATRNADGSIHYDPKRSNTVVVITGDNGSYLFTVKAPFDPLHAKAYANQTGVWVPLVVAGPMVVSPGRDVDAMLNVADLYALFGEIAGVNVRNAVPASRAVDASPVMPYLTNPKQAPIRTVNFTHLGDNLRAVTAVQGACVLSIGPKQICTTLFPQQQLCQNEGGVWYGPGSTVSGVQQPGFSSCCQVNNFLANSSPPLPMADTLPQIQQAVRNRDYKLLRIVGERYDTATQSCKVAEERFEFYRIDQAVPVPLIDRPDGPLANNLGTTNLNAEQQSNYTQLLAELKAINDSVVACPGDGNLDGVVDTKDLIDLDQWAKTTHGKSTWFDFNFDGLTDAADRAIVTANLGKTCAQPR